MKLVRVGLTLALLFAPIACSSQTKAPEKVVAGYDVGSCSPTDYYAVHFDKVGDDLNLTWMNEEEGEVVKQPTPTLYKFQKEDKAGRHYTSPTGKIELVLKTDQDMIFGLALVDGKFSAALIGVEGDGSKLAANGVMMYKVCQDLRAGEEPKDKQSTPASPKASQDPSAFDQHFAQGGPIVKI